MTDNGTVALVLAAGKGTRMKSKKAKVLHQVFFAPMVQHVLAALQPLSLTETVVVTGHQAQAVEEALVDFAPTFVRQLEQKGTGHAVLAAQPHLVGRQGTGLILCGDTPLVRTPTLAAMLAQHRDREAVLTIMTTELVDPSHYGRIVTDPQGRVAAVVEEKDASPEQRRICEVNAGIYCVDLDFLFAALERVGTENEQQEMYLTDIVGLAVKDGLDVQRFVCNDAEELLGVNSRLELARANQLLQQRRNRQLMAAGVSMVQPETVWVSNEVEIGADTTIEPQVWISGRTRIGTDCRLRFCCRLVDCQLADQVEVGPFSVLEGQEFTAGAVVPPGTILSRGNRG